MSQNQASGGNMAISTINIVERDNAVAQAAMIWLQRFYPAVRVEQDDHSLALVSGTHDQEQLTRIWRAALLNEQLLAAADGPRRVALSALLQ
jgi:hypothetical protein